MTPFGETELVDESDLNSSDLIELSKELTRVIEKDIESLSATRFGFTPWSLLTALGAVGLILFGVGKGIFEADPTLVGRAYLFSYFTFQWLDLLVASIDLSYPVKSNRVYFPRERFGYSPILIFRSISFVVGIVVALRVWERNGWFMVALVGLSLVSLIYVVIALPLLLNPLTGNNPRFSKAAPVIIVIWNLGSATLVLGSFLYLQWPTESTATSFAIGGLLAVLVFLAERYVVVLSPNPIVTRLSSLRDDIIFRRKSINGGLLELRRIREGSTFFEALATEIEIVHSKTNEKFQTFEIARGLLDSIEELLNRIDSDMTNLEQRLEQIEPFWQAYSFAKANVLRLKQEIDQVMDQLIEKSNKVVAASGDLDSPQLFDSYFNETHKQLDADLLELGKKETEVAERITNFHARKPKK